MYFSTTVACYNLFTGASGLQFYEEFYYVYYSFMITSICMLFTLNSEQDLPFSSSASIEIGVPSDYLKEEKTLTFSIANYYTFSKKSYIKSTLKRMIAWSAYSFWAGFVCCMVPFMAFGNGVVNIEGKSDDLYAAGEATFMLLVVIFHL